ncbi:DUF1289 domain-containing protein [Methylophilaceae bacterium]|jgi:uncharacterized protein|nr:MAG: Fe-S oxidoreductase [Methylophilales bacterium BACL14 MAG-120910-bin43]KRP07715.1 MAG: Fe-S oxidoreductase [Methylophilales bacterium BACL14 MAG-120920-bin58]MDA7700299.1 DUF1289 domain-containing protein [Methylophilaceae bacterium]
MSDLIDQTVESPCVGVCQYNDEEFCSGCFRTAYEISEWSMMSKETKRKVIELLPSRMEELF